MLDIDRLINCYIECDELLRQATRITDASLRQQTLNYLALKHQLRPRLRYTYRLLQGGRFLYLVQVVKEPSGEVAINTYSCTEAQLDRSPAGERQEGIQCLI